MSDPTVSKVPVGGSVCVWTYGEDPDYPGWHFCCDPEAAIDLLSLADTMSLAELPGRKAIRLVSDPAFCRAANNDASPHFARSLEIRYDESNDPEYWKLTEHDGNLFLTLGPNTLAEFRAGVVDVSNGKGDYSMGDEPFLWFWWMID